MKLLIKQEYATFYLKDKETIEVLYGGAAIAQVNYFFVY